MREQRWLMDDLSFVFEIFTVSAVISADADISGSQSASLLRHSGRRAGIQCLCLELLRKEVLQSPIRIKVMRVAVWRVGDDP